MPTTVVARLPNARPVPWVAVLIAPATDCTLMSPRFGIANPTDVELVGERSQRDPGVDRDTTTRACRRVAPSASVEREQHA